MHINSKTAEVISLILAGMILVVGDPALAAQPISPFSRGSETPAKILESLSPTRGAEGPYNLDAALQAGAHYLRQSQADITEDNAGNGAADIDPNDGGWDWVLTDPAFTHSASASPTNIYGATAQGVLKAYLVSGDASLFTALSDAAIYMISDPNVRSAADLIFLMSFDDLPGVPGSIYQNSARMKYDGRITTYGTAQALAEYIRDVRAGQGYENGIIAWDIGAWAVAAAMLDARYPGNGYDTDADDIAEVIYQDSFNDNPGYFDIDDQCFDPTYSDPNCYWYTIGITGLIDAFHAANVHTGEISGLCDILLESQYDSGAFSDSYGAPLDNEDWQTTAYVMMSLARVDQPGYQPWIAWAGNWLAGTQHTSGGWVYSSGEHYPEIGGECTAALYHATAGSDNVTPQDASGCLPDVIPCLAIPVVLNRTDTTPSRAISVHLQLSSNLVLCTDDPETDIVVALGAGSWLDTYTDYNHQIIDHGGGAYTVDIAVLGIPCGPTGYGTLFTVSLTPAPGVVGEVMGAVTVTDVRFRGCDNVFLPAIPGPAASISIDLAGPPMLGDLTAVQRKTGNDSDGTTIIDLSWTAPGGDAESIEIWYKGYGNYPEYDDGPSPDAIPTAPVTLGNDWSLFATLPATDIGDEFEVTIRDFYYFAAYVIDTCGNYSDATDIVGGVLNYHLGDVTDGTTPGTGNNVVDIDDISLLGDNYGITIPHDDPVNYLDVGRTTDYSVDALPITDNLIEFEDLVMFAINFDAVSKNWTSPQPALANELRLERVPSEVGGTLQVALQLAGDGTVQALSVPLIWNDQVVEPIGMQPGELMDRQGGLCMVLSPRPGTVDAAMIGARDQGICGKGLLATVHFRVKADGDPGIGLGEIKARDARNQDVSLNGAVDQDTPSTALPRQSELQGAQPNPFNPLTKISFYVVREGWVSLQIYTLQGRLIKTLWDGQLTAGPQERQWDGTDADGQRISSGTYLVRMQAPDNVQSKSVSLVK